MEVTNSSAVRVSPDADRMLEESIPEVQEAQIDLGDKQENDKFDDLQKAENNFLTKLSESAKKEPKLKPETSVEEKMAELVKQAEVFAHFLLAKHKSVGNKKTDLKTNTTAVRRRRESGAHLESSDTEPM